MKYFKRFNDIDIDYIHTDKHIHSKWTDGNGSVRQIVKKAKELGLKQIAIVDHIRNGSSYFNRYCKEIEKVSSQLEIGILAGFEAKVKDFQGNIDAPPEALKKAKIQVVSVHRFPIGKTFYEPQDFKKSICQEIELELSIMALRNGQFNVLGHPGGMSLSIYKEFPLSFFEKIILECKRNNIAFEINGAYHLGVLKALKVLLKKHNIFVSLGSDAHKLGDIAGSMERFKRVIIDG